MRSRSWRLTREAQPVRGVTYAAVLAGLFCASVLGAIVWTCDHHGVAAIWPATGLMVAALLLLPRRLAWATVAVCLVADFVIKATLGTDLERNLIFGGLGLVEAVMTTLLTRRLCGAALDVMSLRRYFLFIAGAVIPAVVAVTVAGSALFAWRFGQPLWDTWLPWFLADALGLILTVPMVLLAGRPRRYARDIIAGPWERAALLGVVAAASAVVFAHDGLPMVFMLFPLLLLVTFRMGPVWTSVSIGIMAAFAVPLTLAGHGPMALKADLDGPQRAVMLQVYLAVMLVSVLPAAGVLAGRRRDREALARKVCEARAAREAAESAARAKTQFLAVMSHEIRTPLNGLLGFIQIIGLRQDLPADLRRQVELMGGSCDVLLSLVNDVLDLSRLEAGRVELDPRRMVLADVLGGAVEMIRPAAESKQLALDVDLSAIEGLVHMGDDNRLAQVALNLLGNAVKFTATGSVRLSAERRPAGEGRETIAVSVRDTGIGVPNDRRDRLFQVFSQVDGSIAREFGGSGLGLAISRRLIEMMGGEMGYRPAAPQGSEFWFEVTLPTAAAQSAAPAEIEAEVAGMRVLVVDDHPVNREVARLMLEASGCVVSTRSDGAAAVEAVRTEAFDLVFMDVHMPGMDGLAAATAIRALSGDASRVPIVAMTADTASADVEACRRAGMDGHLPKPVRRERLIEALAQYGLADGAGAGVIRAA